MKTVLMSATTLSLGLALAGCSGADTTAESADGVAAITVSSTDTECQLTADESPAGVVSFSVRNEGNQVTEFYLYAQDGQRIIGEVENIGPGLTRDLIVTAAPGTYETACKPGMAGDGIRAPFQVIDTGDDSVGAQDIDAETATAAYATYVRSQAKELLARTKAFAQVYKDGDDDAARADYATTRMYWEAIEPVAESFGDLDPKLDLREADLEPGQRWTGWHRIEKDLWPPKRYDALTPSQRAKLADQLVKDTETLERRVVKLSYTPDQLANGAKELLDEVATGKVTGEEEIWSHTDLYDFQANVDGARVAFEALEPIVAKRDPQLAEQLSQRFDEIQQELAKYQQADGFISYTELSPQQVRTLARGVDALSEPLSKLTAVVVQ